MQTAFKVTALSLTEWSVITVFSALILIIVELKKFFQKRK